MSGKLKIRQCNGVGIGDNERRLIKYVVYVSKVYFMNFNEICGVQGDLEKRTVITNWNIIFLILIGLTQF